jgi:large subunit ribosomal protein L25
MSEVVLNAEIREITGKKSKRVRLDDKIPGIFYANGEQNLNIQVLRTNLAPLIYTSRTNVIELHVPGSTKKCILRDVQFDPVSDKPVHFDLQGLQEDKKLTLEIPVVLTGGTPKGVREGGMLQHIMHKMKVSCLPRDIPEKVEINVGDLEMNRSVHVSDITLPNVTILENSGSAVVAVVPPLVVKEVTPAEAPVEAPAEPEVLSKGKKVEEGEEEAEK